MILTQQLDLLQRKWLYRAIYHNIGRVVKWLEIRLFEIKNKLLQ